jgi:hypothetical protein
MKKSILVTTIVLVMPFLLGFSEGPSKKETKPVNTRLQSCPRVINNSDCHVNFTFRIFGPFPACPTSACTEVIGTMVDGGNTRDDYPCDGCMPLCDVEMEIHQIGSQSYSGIFVLASGGTWNITGTPGCNATTISWNGTDFEIN